MPVLVDTTGRSFSYLRLSLTEACNFRCTYCLPEGYRPHGAPVFLGIDEIRRLLNATRALGLTKVRFSGGEPTLRGDLTAIIGTAAAMPGIQKVALTTNGYRLAKQARQWREAGLTALNVSVDSLDPECFRRITGRDRGDTVRAGIETALSLGFDAVKLNAVLLRGVNDTALDVWLEYLRERDVSVRFIELMRTGDNRMYFERYHCESAALERRLRADGWRLRARIGDAGPAREYEHALFRGRIGFITPYSEGFCASCNRLRVTARGHLRLCLFGDRSIPLRPFLQSDTERDRLIDIIVDRLQLKPAGHRLHQGITGLTHHLASIGG